MVVKASKGARKGNARLGQPKCLGVQGELGLARLSPVDDRLGTGWTPDKSSTSRGRGEHRGVRGGPPLDVSPSERRKLGQGYARREGGRTASSPGQVRLPVEGAEPSRPAGAQSKRVSLGIPRRHRHLAPPRSEDEEEGPAPSRASSGQRRTREPGTHGILLSCAAAAKEIKESHR